MRHKNVAGVILAGGRARRMDQQDKGLIPFMAQPLISYAISALTPVVPQIIINANRNMADYQAFGWPVISDQNTDFDGPLAGILAAMQYTDADILLILPCDCPLIKSAHIESLLHTYFACNADIAVAFDGQRLHSVFLAINCKLKVSLQAYLASKQRKVDTWLQQHSTVRVDFSHTPNIFTNLNTMQDLINLENQHKLTGQG